MDHRYFMGTQWSFGVWSCFIRHCFLQVLYALLEHLVKLNWFLAEPTIFGPGVHQGCSAVWTALHHHH